MTSSLHNDMSTPFAQKLSWCPGVPVSNLPNLCRVIDKEIMEVISYATVKMTP